jgi:hypothetical protein
MVPATEANQLTYNDNQPTPTNDYALDPAPSPDADTETTAAGSDAGYGSYGSGSYGSGSSAANNEVAPFWAHRTSVFAEALYLRPRGATVSYAVPFNGIAAATAVPFGTVGTINPGYAPDFRAGVTVALTRCASIQVAYTQFQSIENGGIFTNPPLTIRSLVTDPRVFTAAVPNLASVARYETRFQFGDVDYRRLLSGGQNWYVNYSVGGRYALLNQIFRESQTNVPGTTNVLTNNNFEGAGARVGLQAARQCINRGFLIYGKTYASVLAGNNRARYLQLNNFTGIQSQSAWADFRTVPILEYELGGGWRSANGRIQITAGYYFGAWFNTLSTGNFIQTVQANNYNSAVNNSSALTFDGLTTRVTYLW